MIIPFLFLISFLFLFFSFLSFSLFLSFTFHFIKKRKYYVFIKKGKIT